MKRAPIVVAIMLLTACSGPSSGKVIDRAYHGSWSESSTSCETKNANGTCKKWDTDVIVHPERCELELTNGNKQGWIDVPCSEFPNYGMGDKYPKEK